MCSLSLYCWHQEERRLQGQPMEPTLLLTVVEFFSWTSSCVTLRSTELLWAWKPLLRTDLPDSIALPPTDQSPLASQSLQLPSTPVFPFPWHSLLPYHFPVFLCPCHLGSRPPLSKSSTTFTPFRNWLSPSDTQCPAPPPPPNHCLYPRNQQAFGTIHSTHTFLPTLLEFFDLECQKCSVSKYFRTFRDTSLLNCSSLQLVLVYYLLASKYLQPQIWN